MKKVKLKTSIKAKIVVGLGYGDEGKGLTVNELCTKRSVVVRFSGGQQAGHTVNYKGTKHTFSNFGAGSFKGAPTYFTEHTTFYPIGIKYEKRVLETLGVNPTLVIHPLAKLTTPWDVYENRNCEANLAHGTCGLGVGKTMKRNEGPFKIYAIDLSYPAILEEKLAQIEKNYYAKGFKKSPELEREVEEFMEAVSECYEYLTIDTYEYLLDFKSIIFEGSQGIMLDMDHGVFPNVTYSNTTSKNAIAICEELGIKNIEVFCITRAYSTRHGKGNGTYEGDPVVLTENEEETNVLNKYQGEFLVSNLDYDRLDYAIAVECIYSKAYKHSLVITCGNQIEQKFNLSLLSFAPVFSNIYTSLSSKGKFKKVNFI
jgi:adenylosuccinate synthase